MEIESQIPTRFDDVQGIDNAKDELQEIVGFLRDPTQYIVSGAKIPKGALLTGKPGTGKTLLARAIAGESSVPFINVLVRPSLRCSSASARSVSVIYSRWLEIINRVSFLSMR